MNEVYTGIKFSVEFRERKAPDYPQLKLLQHWCEIFDREKLAPPYPGGSFGNLSFRTNGNSFVITGTSVGLKKNISNDCFVEVLSCNYEKNIVVANGLRNPSSESFVHSRIYEARKDVNAIFHGHHEGITQYAEQLNILITKEEKTSGTIELADEVESCLGQHNFIVMKNHGFISIHSDMNLAGNLAMEKLREYNSF